MIISTLFWPGAEVIWYNYYRGAKIYCLDLKVVQEIFWAVIFSNFVVTCKFKRNVFWVSVWEKATASHREDLALP